MSKGTGYKKLTGSVQLFIKLLLTRSFKAITHRIENSHSWIKSSLGLGEGQPSAPVKGRHCGRARNRLLLFISSSCRSIVRHAPPLPGCMGGRRDTRCPFNRGRATKIDGTSCTRLGFDTSISIALRLSACVCPVSSDKGEMHGAEKRVSATESVLLCMA